MNKSKTNKLKNILLELIAWLYALLQVLLCMTFGIIFKENRQLVSCLYTDYLEKPADNFWKEYLFIAIYLPKIYIWDRFLAKTRRGGLAVRMINKHFDRSLPLTHELTSSPIEQVIDMPSDGYMMAETRYDGGNTTVLELAYLAGLVKVTKPKICLEIGTFNGRTTLHIALNAPDAKIYTLDLPNEKREESFKNTELLFDNKKYSYLRNRIETLYGDSKTFDFSFLENSVEFIFVDGEHSENYLLNDSEIALSVIKPGGVIVWHDYSVWDGVTRGLDLFAKRNRHLNIVHLQGTSLAFTKYEVV
jgi:predicted O-methyltransferase YrrM